MSTTIPVTASGQDLDAWFEELVDELSAVDLDEASTFTRIAVRDRLNAARDARALIADIEVEAVALVRPSTHAEARDLLAFAARGGDTEDVAA